jgi:hypothetical protein
MKLFLDDFRTPQECTVYMSRRVGVEALSYAQDGWTVVKNYEDFKMFIETNPMPEIISFDHDLHSEHYLHSYHMNTNAYLESTRQYKEKTGYDCAVFLKSFCKEERLSLPKCLIHSMNELGSRRIAEALDIYQSF